MRGKGRPRFGNGRTYTDQRTETAEAVIRICANQQVGQPVLLGPLTLSIAMEVEVPASWSKRKRADALANTVRPTGKPDLDNVAKLIADALNGIVWKDDAQLCSLTIARRYAEKAQTAIWVRVA